MKIASINISDYGSTGRIMLLLSKAVRAAGNDAVSFSRNWWGHSDAEGHTYFGYRTEHLLHHALGYMTGLEGAFSCLSTADLIRQLRRYRPDILHLHNLHGWYIDLKQLFGYIKQEDIRIVWTMHDCWPFTGHCPYFDYAGCRKWIDGCHDCPQYRAYPESLVDNSSAMYRKKKELFSGIGHMTVVCPSGWLADLVRQSFLGCYDVRVIHNGIDTSAFRNVSSGFRAEHGISENDRVILGVSSGWEERKGIDVFPRLGKLLGKGYRTVLVGIEPGTAAQASEDTVLIERTSDQSELAKIYSAADVFVNPTREDNYPTVNLEAIACGTPVVTFDTGGSSETILPGCGISVPKDDVEAMADAVRKVCEDRTEYSENCRKTAWKISSEEMIGQYISLYEGKIDR